MGIAGRIARAFLHSKLTPLVTVASLAVGLLAIAATPREEEPQISVPMIDVIAMLPGAEPEEVENRLTRPLERRMWEIPGVEYVYAMAADGMTLVTVRFVSSTSEPPLTTSTRGAPSTRLNAPSALFW
jgi:multidrug efflux pump subunit AcrB